MAVDAPPDLCMPPVQRLDYAGHDEIIVRPIGDVHIGNPAFDHAYWERLLREIRDTPNMYWIGCGDYIENANKKQKHGGVYGQTMGPGKQVRVIQDDLAPIAGKCLGMIGGNHDHWSKDDVDLDPARIIAQGLGVEEKYGEDGLVVRIELGPRTRVGGRRGLAGSNKARYVFYVTHGSSGSALVGGKALALQRAGDVCLADVVIGAHVHSEIVFKSVMYTPTFHDVHNVTYREVTYVNTGSLLGYTAYARTRRYRPQPVGVPAIHLDVHREKVTVRV